MISILVTAALSTALGQTPGSNPLENTINILRSDGVSVRDKPSGNSGVDTSGSTYSGVYTPGGNQMNGQYGQAGYGGGYPVSYNYGGGYPVSYNGGSPMNPQGSGSQGSGQGLGGGGFGVSGYAPCIGSPGCHMLFGTNIGPWPGTAGPSGGPGPHGPYPCSFEEQPAVFVPNRVAHTSTGASQEQEKERKESNRRLDDLKTSLEKLTEVIQQLEKRVASGEKLSESTESRVKWLEEELKRRLYWHDLENKLDQRMKPLEESLRNLSQRMEELHQQPADHKSVAPRPADAKGEGALSQKLDAFQANIRKDITSVLLRLDQMEEMLKEERAARLKLEDRLKLHEDQGHKSEKGPVEKDTPKDNKDVPKDLKDAPKDNKDASKDLKDAPKDNKDAPKDLKDAPKDNKDASKDLKDAPKDNKDVPKELKDVPKDKKEMPPTEGESLKENTGRLPQIGMGQIGRPFANVPGNKALVVVSLPAEAKLFLNNQPTRSQGTVRNFLTPPLEPGATFTYVLRAELVHGGQVRVQTQEITFQAGRQANVTFGPASEMRVAGVK